MKNTIVRKNEYFDSVTLMSISNKVLGIEGVEEAVVSMATEMNKNLLNNVGMSTEETDKAKNNDLLIAIKAVSKAKYDKALELIQELLKPKNKKETKEKTLVPKTIDEGIELMENANIALISVPGKFAGREARKALKKGLHVMIFSDNVSLEEELELKKIGREKGLLVMGPDCGTASINNVGLCFANKVRKGNIGIIGASGTGLQEVMVQVHKLGGGISQAIGTGGRDLKEEIGGIMMLEGLKALNNDKNTEIIVLVSKPPAKSVEEKILKEIKKMNKTVVVCFLDRIRENKEYKNTIFEYNLFSAANKAVELSGIIIKKDDNKNNLFDKIKKAKSKLKTDQKYVRALYNGGTLCAEAISVLREEISNIKSNIAKREKEKLENLNEYTGNVLLDLGEDEFTMGKPHPMIEPSLRIEHILKQAEDDTVGVILLDFELGFGSHENPVGATINAIKEAKIKANNHGRDLIFVSYICGTDIDKQNYDLQVEMLEKEDVIIAKSNVEAANVVAEILL